MIVRRLVHPFSNSTIITSNKSSGLHNNSLRIIAQDSNPQFSFSSPAITTLRTDSLSLSLKFNSIEATRIANSRACFYRCCTLDCCKNTMSGKEEDVKEHEGVDEDVPEDSERAMPSPQQEEEAVKSRYGGIMPKKPPLISKDHERAYFDSADWALGKQGGEKPKGPLKALQPKLQPTQQQTRYRKSPCGPSDGEGENTPSEDAAANE